MKGYSLTPVRAQRRLFREEGGSPREWESEHIEEAHTSVLTREVLEILSPKKGDAVLDATAGAGGHSEALLQAAAIRLIAIDADPGAVRGVEMKLQSFGESALVVEGNFKNLKEILLSHGMMAIDKALFDLGWNRGQLFSGRGFSFMRDEPLSMSYGKMPASGFTAADILNTWNEEALADVLFGYGQERYARRIAKKIIEVRRRKKIETTGQLVAIVEEATPALYKRGRVHCATKTFQALRIAVNDELGTLQSGIRAAWEMLSPQGRLAVISFHSTEDRIVKHLFREFTAQGEGVLIADKPITASREEIRLNPLPAAQNCAG